MKRGCMTSLILGVAVFLMAAVPVESAESSGAVKKMGISARPSAANFNLTDLNGNPLSLSALKGKVVLLDFWATWCPPCRAEIPHFVELYSAYKGKGLEVVGLSVDQGGPAGVTQFIKENSVSYPVAMADIPLTQAYGGIRGIPTTFLLDKNGHIAKKYVGYQDKAVFEREIQGLLAE